MKAKEVKKVTLADVFQDLTVLEQILDDLNNGKNVVVKKNDIIYSAITRASTITRNRLFRDFCQSKAAIECALPESKIHPKSAKRREQRRKRIEPIMQILEDYFQNERRLP